MFYKKTALLMVFLSAFNVVPVWALGEAATEVSSIIESERPEPVRDDPAERAARINAARQAAARKQADEKAAVEKKDKERFAASENERLAVHDEQNRSAAGPVPVAADPAATTAAKAPLVNAEAAPPPRPENPGVTDPAPASLYHETVAGAGGTSDSSWWTAFTNTLGLTDSDKGVTVQPASSKMGSPTSEYIIGPGDVIGISVWRDENLTRSVVVLPDGKISLPLVGELVAAGKTVTRLKQEVEKDLSRYTADSVVTVEVKQSNSMIIYVIGRVNSAGKHMLSANTNVLQALAMAGGTNPFAKSSEIKIFRQHEGNTVMFAFNYEEVMQGRHLETNIELKRGDVIIVP